MDCPRCGNGIKLPREMSVSFRPSCEACGWESRPVESTAPGEGFYGEERLARGRGLKYLLLALVLIFLPLLLWNYALPLAAELSPRVRAELRGTPPAIPLNGYLVAAGVYLVLAFVVRFEVAPRAWLLSRWQRRQRTIMMLLIPGRWFWLGLQGLIMGR